jgi:hydrogenase maturation protease
LAGHAPSELIVLGVNPDSCEFAERISQEVLSAASHAAAMIAHALIEHGIDCVLREPAATPNLWWLRMGHVERSVAA